MGIVIGVLFSIFIIAGLIFYQKRDTLLSEAIKKAQIKAKKDYNLNLTIRKAAFSGLKSVLLENLLVVPENGETLASIEHLEVSIKLIPLLYRIIKVEEVNLSNAAVTLIKKDSISNYDFLIKKKPTDTSTITTKSSMLNLATLADKVINNILYKIPDNMTLRNLSLTYEDDSLVQRIEVPTADIDQGDLTSTILVNKDESIWHLEGALNPDRKKLYLKLFAEGKKVEFPLIEKKFGVKLNFDVLETNLETVKWRDNEELLMSGTWKVKNLLINHWRIASNDVVVPDMFLDTELVIGKNYVALDQGSQVKLAKLVMSPYAKFTLGDTKTYAFGVHTESILAQDVFDSFPRGLFTSLEGIRVSGTMKYDLDFFLDEAIPDSVKLDSELSSKNFHVNSWGKTDLSKINSPFVYTAFEDGKAQRSIDVGSGNPNFVRLSDVSSQLKNAVLTAEDPSFFSHSGFVPQAIRASIATNFKAKAFKRGGSTISMQLVKNVYLGREKTLARKVEEMLMVWLIESNRLVSKERMFEVYLNVIEWGRNVYGISEASRYYFSKHPSELDLGESIFLASIVPRPKASLYRFDHAGHLKPYMSGYFRLIGNLMAQRGYAASDSTRSYGFYSVSLREALRPPAPKIDSTQVAFDEDSMFLEDEIKGVRKLLNNLFKKKSKEEEEEVE